MNHNTVYLSLDFKHLHYCVWNFPPQNINILIYSKKYVFGQLASISATFVECHYNSANNAHVVSQNIAGGCQTK